MKAIDITTRQLAALCLTFAAASANAEGIRTDASISNVSFGVSDLTPNDGVEASFTSQRVTNDYYLRILGDGFYRQIDETIDGAQAFHDTLTYRASHVSAIGTNAPGEVSVQSDALRTLGDESSVYGNLYQSHTITLAAHSALTISGRAIVDLDYIDGASPYQRGFAYTDVTLRLGNSRVDRFQLISDSPNGYQTAEFSLYYANASDTDVMLEALFVVANDSYTTVGSVPEPSTYAMLGIGLLAVGAAVRFRTSSCGRNVERIG